MFLPTGRNYDSKSTEYNKQSAVRLLKILLIVSGIVVAVVKIPASAWSIIGIIVLGLLGVAFLADIGLSPIRDATFCKDGRRASMAN